jgi:hypothetical protein
MLSKLPLLLKTYTEYEQAGAQNMMGKWSFLPLVIAAAVMLLGWALIAIWMWMRFH